MKKSIGWEKQVIVVMVIGALVLILARTPENREVSEQSKMKIEEPEVIHTGIVENYKRIEIKEGRIILDVRFEDGREFYVKEDQDLVLGKEYVVYRASAIIVIFGGAPYWMEEVKK